MGTLRKKIRGRVSFFFVAKKSGCIRLIVDCQEANSLMRPAPHAALGGPGALSRVDFIEESLAAAGFKGELDVHIADLDLQDGFYQLECPELASFFEVDDPRPASEWGVDSVWDEEANAEVAVTPSTLLYFTMSAVSMGWSWGVWFCQAVVEEGVRRALGHGRPHELGRTGGLVQEGEVPPLVGPGEPVAAVYVDGAAIIGLCKADVQLGYEKVIAALEGMGLRLHGLRPAARDMDVVGMTFKGGASRAWFRKPRERGAFTRPRRSSSAWRAGRRR